MTHILIVEDEPIIRKSLRRLLERHEYTVSEAASVTDASSNFDLTKFDLIISDLRLPGPPGTELIKAASQTPVLIMTSYASLRSAVDAMKLGAADYIAKPFDHDDMIKAVANSTRKLHAATPLPTTAHQHCSNGPPGFIGNCSKMRQLYTQIGKLAPTDTTVLIHGETGTGKELVAQALHTRSRRADRALISVNCAAIPDTLIESELFGYEKGAFTGATSNRMGLIEAANGGTLFLDEIGELPIEAQARLLRFLQEGEIRAIGSVKTRKVDVRLIAATHRNLKQLSMTGDFREDLYYRINVMQLVLPPLREREGDILQIASTYLTRYCEHFNKLPMKFSAHTAQVIATYPWPGNVRELQNAVERAVILSDDIEISAELLALDFHPSSIPEINIPTPALTGRPATVTGISEDPTEDLSLEDYFQRFVLEHQDSMSETELARKLGVSRKCLWERRQRLGIPRRKKISKSALGH
jgi:two-component system response regulator HydG